MESRYLIIIINNNNNIIINIDITNISIIIIIINTLIMMLMLRYQGALRMMRRPSLVTLFISPGHSTPDQSWT